MEPASLIQAFADGIVVAPKEATVEVVVEIQFIENEADEDSIQRELEVREASKEWWGIKVKDGTSDVDDRVVAEVLTKKTDLNMAVHALEPKIEPFGDILIKFEATVKIGNLKIDTASCTNFRDDDAGARPRPQLVRNAVRKLYH